MQICHPSPPPPRPPVWTLLQLEISFQGPLQERSLENNNMSFLQRRVRWWRPTVRMKKRPQGGLSLAALNGGNLHQGNMSVSYEWRTHTGWEYSALDVEYFVLVLQMRKEYVMYQLSLDHLSLFCGITGTPGKLPTTTSRDTATSGSKVWCHRLKCVYFRNFLKVKNIDHVSGNRWFSHDGILLHLHMWVNIGSGGGKINCSISRWSIIFFSPTSLTVEWLLHLSSTVACFVAFLTEEKKSTLQDMASQRGVACRAQGWKIHLCAAQLRQLVSAFWSDCITW